MTIDNKLLPIKLSLEEAANLFVDEKLTYRNYGGISNYLAMYKNKTYVLRDYTTDTPFYELLAGQGISAKEII